MIRLHFRAACFIAFLVCLTLSGCRTTKLFGLTGTGCKPITSQAAKGYSFKNTRWKLFEADDAEGNSWNNSSLVFLSQKRRDNKNLLEGYFDWFSNGKHQGREYFSGYFSITNGELVLQGKPIKNREHLKASTYHAVLCSDGKTITEGKWDAPNAIPGKWSASLIETQEPRRRDFVNRTDFPWLKLAS